MILSSASPDLEKQIADADLAPNDASEIRKFAAYLQIEAAKKIDGDPAGLLITAQTVIYPDLYGDNEQ